MKNILLLFAFAVTAVSANAQQDTLTVVRPDSVSIVRNERNVDVRIFGNGGNSDYRYSMNFDVDGNEPLLVNEKKATKSKEFDMSLPLFNSESNTGGGVYVEASVCIGLLWGCNFVSGAPKEVDINPYSSIDIWLPNIFNIYFGSKKSKFSANLNYGIEWRNFRMKDNYRFTMNDDKVVGYERYADGLKPDFSRIKVLSQTLSLTGRYNFCKGGYIRLGPVLSFNNGLSVKTKYKDADGRKIKEKQNDPKANKVSLEWVGSFQFYDFGFWVKYSPRSILRKDFGPQFTTTTVGVSIGW